MPARASQRPQRQKRISRDTHGGHGEFSCIGQRQGASRAADGGAGVPRRAGHGEAAAPPVQSALAVVGGWVRGGRAFRRRVEREADASLACFR